MTEVEEKNAKETDKVESALQRAIHITKLLIIWAARSFLYVQNALKGIPNV